ncbi:MAG: hypothetical protein ACREBE_16160 [bacterium]
MGRDYTENPPGLCPRRRLPAGRCAHRGYMPSQVCHPPWHRLDAIIHGSSPDLPPRPHLRSCARRAGEPVSDDARASDANVAPPSLEIEIEIEIEIDA